ncbi:MAG: hypothetical protein QGF46_00700 [Planctomycetota bacterium]|nr:hypothetical protein [Planctomycetota bacterium]
MAVQHDNLDNMSLANITLASTFLIIATVYLVAGLDKSRATDLAATNNVQSIVEERQEIHQKQMDGVNSGDMSLADAKQQVIESYKN